MTKQSSISRWSSSIADDDAIGTDTPLVASSGEGASVMVDDLAARVGALSRALPCDEDAELTAVLLLPTVVCESFFGSPKSRLSDPFKMSPKRTGDRDGVREDSENIPSASSILRFAGLKSNDTPGENGLLFPDLNGLFGKLGLEGRNCSKGNS